MPGYFFMFNTSYNYKVIQMMQLTIDLQAMPSILSKQIMGG